jgi:hypothetical protein
MKKWISMALGLAVIAVLAYLAFAWQRKPEPSQKTGSSASTIPRLPKMVELDRLKSLKIQNELGIIKFAKGEDGSWKIVEPGKDLPERIFFNSFIDELDKLGPVVQIPPEEQEAMSQYGLEKPLQSLSLEYDDGRSKVLKIGKDNPTGDYMYTLFEGEPDVLLVRSRLRMFLQNDWSYYRFRRLSDISREQIKELRVVVLDPQLREQLEVPEMRHLMLQTTSVGRAWVYLEPYYGPAESQAVGNLIGWMEKASLAADLKEIKKEELSAWQLEPPRAYLEMVYPDRSEKVMVGRELSGKIYLYQDKRPVILGYDKNTILELLARELRPHKLLRKPEMKILTKVEVDFPGSSNAPYNIARLDQEHWAVNRDPAKKFPKVRLSWLTLNFTERELDGYVGERPIPPRFGLQKPRVDLKFYSNAGLEYEIQIGAWDQKLRRCYVYYPQKDLLVYYGEDVAEWIPPDADKFLLNIKQP